MSDMLRRTLGESIAVEVVLAGGLWRVNADPNQLESAILNLAINARDAMPGGGKLTIETGNTYLAETYADEHDEVIPGQYVLLAVSDTGTGMSRETIAKAFEPFFTTKQMGEGTGLGLSMIYGFVKQSGGHVKIYSEIGVGTVVKMYLPRLVDGAPVASTAPASVNVAINDRREEVVLVVEDDELVREYSTGLFHELGFDTLEARDAASALKIIEGGSRIDLLFTDVGLPGGTNGRQLADEVHRRRPEIKVLFTTGYTRNAIVHNGTLDHGVELITKPFTFEALLRKIREILPER
jgi:CheY-like chemotaxis protein